MIRSPIDPNSLGHPSRQQKPRGDPQQLKVLNPNPHYINSKKGRTLGDFSRWKRAGWEFLDFQTPQSRRATFHHVSPTGKNLKLRKTHLSTLQNFYDIQMILVGENGRVLIMAYQIITSNWVAFHPTKTRQITRVN